MQASDIDKIHKAKCPNYITEMQVSCDGMSETKSTSVSLDVYSSRRSNCQVIYPYKIIRPLRKYPINHLKHFSAFLNDIINNSGQVKQYVADNLKRATGKGSLNHKATFPCEYCFSRGIRCQLKDNSTKTSRQFTLMKKKIKSSANGSDYSNIEKELEKAEKIMSNKKRTTTCWPASTAGGEPRTTEKIEEILQKIEASETKLPLEEAKGIVCRSPLMSVPGFDFVLDSSAEYLHSVCLGVSKRLIELTFNVGDNRQRITNRKLSLVTDFNREMQNIKVVRECSRRVRDLDFSVLKGQEFRNITLFFFPVILSCIVPPAPERKLWLMFSYMIRSCILPTQEFKCLQLNDIEETCRSFYKLYEKLFGQFNCTYNTHVVGSHLLEMRARGPLTCTSAFEFESFYGEIRNSFTPGTQSTLKQIFKKKLIKRLLGYHCCENTIYFSDHETSLENDTLVYIFQDSIHKMFKICEIDGERLICYKQGRYNHTFNEMPNIDFSKVGVYKRGPISSEKVTLFKKNVSGKVLSVHDFLITCPNNVLREK